MSEHFTHPDPAVRELITEAKVAALREAADDLPGLRHFARWLRDRADRIETGA